MKALILSIGTRGDMEPFVAMAELLRKNKWDVVCGMPEQFQEMVESRGIPFFPFDKRFMELIDSHEGRMIMGQQGSVFKRFKAIIKLSRNSLALQGSMIKEQYELIRKEKPDLIIYHGKCIYPVIWAIHNPGKTIMMSAMPCLIHPQKAYPNIGIRINLGPTFNLWTYRFVNSILAITTKRCSKHIPHEEIDHTLFTKRKIKDFLVNQQPYFYSFSPSIFKRPANWPQHVLISGFRELEKAKDYTPSQELTNFLNKHRKILFVSFGSMVNANPKKTTESIISVLNKKEIPTIINISWGGLQEPETYPDHLLFVQNIPYDWLFMKIYAVVHHGGSGTTHTTLKFGCPSLVIPHIVDQFFWGKTIHQLGAGPESIPIKKIHSERLEQAITSLWLNPAYKDVAENLALKMANENFEKEILDTIASLTSSNFSSLKESSIN